MEYKGQIKKLKGKFVMRNFFSKLCGALSSVRSKTSAFLAVMALTLFGSSAFAVDLVTAGEDGAVTINPDAIVDPVRTAITSAITSCVTIFVIVLCVGFVFWLIKRCTKG